MTTTDGRPQSGPAGDVGAPQVLQTATCSSAASSPRAQPQDAGLDLNATQILMQRNVISHEQQQQPPAELTAQVSQAPRDQEPPPPPTTTPLRRSPGAGRSAPSGAPTAAAGSSQWLAQVAVQAQLGVRARVSQASDQLDLSLRHLYASASSIAAADARPPSYHNIPGIVPFYSGRSLGPPPSYDDVVNPHAPPPSYQSLFGQMRAARKSSRGLLDLLRRLLVILASTLGCTLLVAVIVLVPFTMIIVGAVYIDECRVEHIPAFLLAGGLVWASKNALHCYAQCRRMDAERGSPASSPSGSSFSLSGLGTAISGGGGGGGGGDLAESGSQGSAEFAYLAAAAAARRPSASPSLVGQRGDAPQRPLVGALATTHTSAHNPADPLASFALEHAQHADQHHQQQQQQQDDASGRLGFECAAGRRARRTRTARNERGRRRLKSSICESLLNCVLFGWFIAGCVIVVRNYEPDFEDPTSARYCHRTVYMYTLWLVSSAALLLGLFVGCICCLVASSAVASRADEPPGDLAAA